MQGLHETEERRQKTSQGAIMSQDKYEIVKMAREAGLWVTGFPTEHIERFATLCRAPLIAENEGLKESLESVLSQLKERDAELARVRAGEPFGWYSAKEDDFMLDKIRKTHERLNSHTHRIGKYDTALFTAPQPAAQEPTSAVPVVEQLVLAATAVIDYDESDPDDGVTMMLNYADALAKCRDAIAAGQKFIKENGK